MSRSSAAVAIQASLISWEGGRDLCANLWDGKLVLEHTIERVKRELPELPIWLLVPQIPENEPLRDLAASHGVSIVFGPFDDVVERYMLLPEDTDTVVRLAGVHPFFSERLARDMLEVIADDETLEIVLPPEDVDVQFTVQVFSLAALRRASKRHLQARLKVDPARVLGHVGVKAAVMPNRGYEDEIDRARLRRLAQSVYQDDVLHVNQDSPYGNPSETSQILCHYEFALEYCTDTGRQDIRNILDVGGALGFRTVLQRRSPRPLDYTVLDIDPEKVSHGRELDPQSTFVEGDCCNLPFAEDTFDVVFACEIIEHVDDPVGLMTEALRVTRPGGFVVVSTPQNRSGKTPLNPHHVREYTREGFASFGASFPAEVTYFTFFSGCNREVGLVTGNNMLAVFRKPERGSR